MCLMNEIFSNQLLQLCLIDESAVKTLYLLANDSRERLMGTGGSIVTIKPAFYTKLTLQRSIHSFEVHFGGLATCDETSGLPKKVPMSW